MKVNRINPEITLLYDPRYIRSVEVKFIFDKNLLCSSISIYSFINLDLIASG